MSSHFFRSSKLLWVGLALTIVTTHEARASEAYYLIMFGSQRANYNPNYSHTFATFVRVAWPGNGPCPPGGASLEAYTISWLPENLIIRLGALCPEPGRNFDLYETIRFAQQTCQRISMWGPYPITRELYCLGLERIRELNSGQIQYKANDTLRNSDRVSNCIHAVSSTVEQMRVRVGSPGWGETATYVVLRRFRPWIIEETPHYWVSSALGLDSVPLIYRNERAPRTGLLLGPLQTGLGRVPAATYGPPR